MDNRMVKASAHRLSAFIESGKACSSLFLTAASACPSMDLSLVSVSMPRRYSSLLCPGVSCHVRKFVNFISKSSSLGSPQVWAQEHAIGSSAKSIGPRASLLRAEYSAFMGERSRIRLGGNVQCGVFNIFQRKLRHF